MWRDEMVADFLNPVYEMWLSEEIAAGRIGAPGWSDPRLRTAWLSCQWAGSPMPNIDPLKTANADRAYVEMGAQTLDDVARNYNGSSGKANRSKNKRQYEELTPPPWDGWTGIPESETKDNDNEEDVVAKNSGEYITVKSPAMDFDFQVKKRKMKKIVNYVDIHGKSKTAEIYEEEIK